MFTITQQTICPPSHRRRNVNIDNNDRVYIITYNSWARRYESICKGRGKCGQYKGKRPAKSLFFTQFIDSSLRRHGFSWIGPSASFSEINAAPIIIYFERHRDLMERTYRRPAGERTIG